MADELKDQDALTEEDAAKRRDEALRRALGTPPKPRKGKPISKEKGGKHKVDKS